MGRPPKNQDSFNADNLLNEIETLKAEKAELKDQLEFQKSVTDGIIKDWTEKYNEQSEMLKKELQSAVSENYLTAKNTPRPIVAGIKITAGHSVHYKGTSYLPNQVIQNPPESDIDELLKFGELV